MKKSIFAILMTVLVISAFSAVSAKTIVAGKIYDSPNFETAGPVAGANVNVTCNQSLETTVSLADGTYSVGFNVTEDCPNLSNVSVVAEKGGISNSGTGTVHDYTAIIPDLYIGVVNIALIPEFGLIVGVLTVLSAVGIFFVVRRK